MKQRTLHPDVFGHAVSHYFYEEDMAPIEVYVNDFDTDYIPVDYLFRGLDEMPQLEQEALKHVEGKTIDIGCCAGSHSLVLEQKQVEVTAIDSSEKCIDVCKQRGLKHAIQIDLYSETFKSIGQFDTILCLMNGIGLAGHLKQLPLFFKQLKAVLKPTGKILIDSTDLNYLFEPENSQHYYGELVYRISYKNFTSEAFKWLYIDQDLLKLKAEEHGLTTKILFEENDSFLAELSFT